MTPDIIRALVPLTAVVMGVSVVLIPIAGLTLRFALKPMMAAMASLRDARTNEEQARLLESRVALLEEQLHGMDRSLRLLSEEAEFRRQLESGAPAARSSSTPSF